ncbi:SWF/SNF helicase family protein [Zophobihabitans entericus]|uniref:SWF/SNF helicase family protein n=1 Tax=Zophobihabitans entericus TaxID=1635327 RepID=A0A6G9IEA8_9GAMM|nr:SWF/SNF helicase family protein [Zophobihabitans entericus]QIQ22152.1 SWF/SNF helicase family protein [Zophobihabitans entericus]
MQDHLISAVPSMPTCNRDNPYAINIGLGDIVKTCLSEKQLNRKVILCAHFQIFEILEKHLALKGLKTARLRFMGDDFEFNDIDVLLITTSYRQLSYGYKLLEFSTIIITERLTLSHYDSLVARVVHYGQTNSVKVYVSGIKNQQYYVELCRLDNLVVPDDIKAQGNDAICQWAIESDFERANTISSKY